MHLLAARPGEVADGSQPVDLGQSPATLAVLSAADTELALLAEAAARRGAGAPSLRLANVMQLGHHLSVDLYVEAVVARAKVVVARLLGGAAYWRYGSDELAAAARRHGTLLALLPGDDREDGELRRLSTVAPGEYDRLWAYLVHGGAANAAGFLATAAALAGHPPPDAPAPPQPLPRAGCYWPGAGDATLEEVAARRRAGRQAVAVVFYRALVQAGDTAPIDALVRALQRQGLDPLPLYSQSLRDPAAAAFVEEALARHPPAVVVNCTGFALGTPGAAPLPQGAADAAEHRGGSWPTPFDAADCPVVQAVMAGGTRQAWQRGTRGLAPRDIAMNVALPEVDGRLLARAISFKSARRRDEATQCHVVRHEEDAAGVTWTARLAAAWAKLRATPACERRIAIVLANYPNRDGRIGNGVGLDTPASAAAVLAALAGAGYRTGGAPPSGAALIAALLAGPTNDLARRTGKNEGETLPLATYRRRFAALPAAVRRAVVERWGEPQNDPHVAAGAFRLAIRRWGHVALGVQPARGYNIDPKASYHDPDLVPPHGYFAFYMWLTSRFGAHAAVHLGKHGNLEWLPGKALALAPQCFPAAALPPLPHLYTFIVNDPGEGTQAKRRSAAVVVDHLTPPLARAEAHGALRRLEVLVDEYFEAGQTDPRRLPLLAADILDLAAATGLDADCGMAEGEDEAAKLARLDGYLCELKEMQIRDGLHVFGASPQGGLETALLAALARLPRGDGQGGDASLQAALAADLELGLDPLAPEEPARPWTGPRPAALRAVCGDPWRSTGDTVERLELLAAALIAGETACPPAWRATAAVLEHVRHRLRPALAACGPREMEGLLAGLDGRFVAPGPSGAPTRGRPDVLPTGRNFYSVDTRAVPTPAAWRLGWASACRLLERHCQEHGEWPAAVALSAWGTATMRTGGDDIAQALALMGVAPRWQEESGRLAGFEILPASVLGRPRVDVTLRVSGFFRDAFPALIDLVDSAARAVAALDEPPEANPLAARVKAETRAAALAGEEPEEARRRAATRVFGSKPGAYGAGLQAPIDEGGWQDRGDLARAYIAWSGYAYGDGAEGRAAHGLFERRLAGVEAVLHNQDNREHDLLDSDDYYQFEGGLTAAVEKARGSGPAVYHNDHSNPAHPRIRTLAEEIARVVRARAANPKWIAGVMRHGYKGAAEMAATVDYLFAFAATTGCVRDSHFDALFDAYLGDEAVRAFLRQANPAALAEMAARMAEVQRRGLWRPRRNSALPLLQELAAPASRAAAGQAREEAA